MPSLVVIEQPNDSNISTADKLSRVLRARRDMEAGARHPDALVQREKDEINCARRRIHSELTTLKSIKSTAHAQKSALLWIIKEHGWGGGGGRGVINVCRVWAAGLSEPPSDHNLYCGQF